MTETLFVSNLPASATEEQIQQHFSRIGDIQSLNLKTDRKGRSRCFGFITIGNADEAISELNDQEFQGRKLKVAKAYPLQSSFRPQFQRRFRREY